MGKLNRTFDILEISLVLGIWLRRYHALLAPVGLLRRKLRDDLIEFSVLVI